MSDEFQQSLLHPGTSNVDDQVAQVRLNSETARDVVNARLTANGIHVGKTLLLADDIAGITDAGGNAVAVHSYPRRAHGCFGARERAEMEHILYFASDDAGEKHRWLHEWGRLWDRGAVRRLLVLINPVGGKKQARGIWDTVASKMFHQAGIEVEVVETTHQGHAIEIVSGADLSAVDGIVCVSGDGLVVEVVNGLQQRSDAHAMGAMPLGVIPAGTGNGLATSFLFKGGEKCDATSCVLAIIRGHVEKLDAARVEQGGEPRFYSVLSIGWGLASDTDVESDAMRWCGPVRFTIQGVFNIAKKRVYQGSLRLLSPPTQAESLSNPTREQVPSQADGSQWRTLEGNFSMVWALNVTHCAFDNMTAPYAELCDGCYDVLVVREEVPRSTIFGMFLEMEKGLSPNCPQKQQSQPPIRHSAGESLHASRDRRHPRQKPRR